MSTIRLSAAALAATALGLHAASPAANAQGFPAIEAQQVKSGASGGALTIAAGDHVIIRLKDNWRFTVEHVGKAGKDDGAAGSPAEGVVDFVLANDSSGATLHVRSGVAKPFRYSAKLLIVRYNQIQSGPAPVCPLQPGQARDDQWPQPIAGIRLESFSETKPDDSACR